MHNLGVQLALIFTSKSLINKVVKTRTRTHKRKQACGVEALEPASTLKLWSLCAVYRRSPGACVESIDDSAANTSSARAHTSRAHARTQIRLCTHALARARARMAW